MIKRIEVYLVTDGNGQEALAYYKDVFGAELVSKKLWADTIPNVAEEHKDRLLNAQLLVDGIRIQISDESPEYEYVSGRNVVLTLVFSSVEEVKDIYDKLAKDAREISLELQETFFSPAYANLIDKYGFNWQLVAELED